MPSERLLPRLFLTLLVAVLTLAGWQWRHGAPLSANQSMFGVSTTASPHINACSRESVSR